MPQDSNIGSIRVMALRGGTISEITEFLNDLESAYLDIYFAEEIWPFPDPLFRKRYEYPLDLPLLSAQRRQAVPPEHILVIQKVVIESPGFWECLASLNPLLQIREYLNDRHKRRQDKEFREASEKDRLKLENEILEQQVQEGRNKVLRERIEVLRQIGYKDEQIRQLIWASMGRSLARLGRHQDIGLIDGSDDEDHK
jgi:hypothetical protein